MRLLLILLLLIVHNYVLEMVHIFVDQKAHFCGQNMSTFMWLVCPHNCAGVRRTQKSGVNVHEMNTLFFSVYPARKI